MKISIFSAFYPFRGGIAHFNERLVKSLDKKHDVAVFTFKKQYPNFLFPGSSQFVTTLNPELEGRAQRIVSTFNPFSYFGARRKLKAIQTDLFIANYWMSIFSVFLSFCSKGFKPSTKRIALIHNLVPHEKRFFDSWLNKILVRNFDAFVVMSEQVKNDLVSLRPDAHILMLEHPWYDQFFEKIEREEACEKLGLDATKKVILFFGLIRDYKGLDVLLEAFSLLDDSYTLLVAGEFYSNREAYTHFIEDPRITSRVKVIDKFIPDDEVHIYFSAADVSVLPYRSATQSGVTATSFHFGVPVIVTDVGGLRQTVQDMGKFVPPNNKEALAAAIAEYFDQSEYSVFKKSIDSKRGAFTWDHFAERLVEFAAESAPLGDK
jgi:glycosyltransferase involved in cell wall biosynthesis